MKAVNIKWDVDTDDAVEYFCDVAENDPAGVSEAIHIPYEIFIDMTWDEKEKAARNYFQNNPTQMAEFLGIPDEISIPDSVESEKEDDAISNYITESTGYCHKGFTVIK